MAIDINQLALLVAGLGAVTMVTQTVLSYLAQRNLNDIMSQGMQAVVGSNTVETVDQQMNDGGGK